MKLAFHASLPASPALAAVGSPRGRERAREILRIIETVDVIPARR